jgi:hypothetical protein
MSKTSILEFLDKATDAIKVIAPIASDFGVPFVEKIAGWADTAVDIAKNATQRAVDAGVVLHSDDVNEINQKIAELDALNNALADYIKNS